MIRYYRAISRKWMGEMGERDGSNALSDCNERKVEENNKHIESGNSC